MNVRWVSGVSVSLFVRMRAHAHKIISISTGNRKHHVRVCTFIFFSYVLSVQVNNSCSIHNALALAIIKHISIIINCKICEKVQ